MEATAILKVLAALLLALAVYAFTWGPPAVHPPTTTASYRSLRTGDMLLCRTGATGFRLSTAFTGAHYSHVGIILAADETTLGVPLVLENGQRVVSFNCGGAAQRLTREVLVDNLGPRLKQVVEQVLQIQMVQ